jgi:hypothetical protein
MIISKDHLFMNTFRKPGIERTFLFIQLKVLSSNPSTAKKKKRKKRDLPNVVKGTSTLWLMQPVIPALGRLMQEDLSSGPAWVLSQKTKNRQKPVVHTCNPSYLGG